MYCTNTCVCIQYLTYYQVYMVSLYFHWHHYTMLHSEKLQTGGKTGICFWCIFWQIFDYKRYLLSRFENLVGGMGEFSKEAKAPLPKCSCACTLWVNYTAFWNLNVHVLNCITPCYYAIHIHVTYKCKSNSQILMITVQSSTIVHVLFHDLNLLFQTQYFFFGLIQSAWTSYTQLILL